MKVCLLHPDHPFDNGMESGLDPNVLTDDLELHRVLDVMANGDSLVRDVCSAILFHPLLSPEEIQYRQRSLQDALAFPEVIRSFYRSTVDAFDRKRKTWYFISLRFDFRKISGSG
jgi:hypothetical protein